jgi:N-sulfoglucosamine sulfohydrolase
MKLSSNRVSPSPVLRWLAGLLLTLGFVSAAAGADAVRRPNILFLFADNWQYEHASAHGYVAVKTPVFDRIVREGARFTNAFCPVPSCGPTRSSLVTGRAAHQLEELANHGGRFPGKFRVFTDALTVCGYHVGYTGKGWAPGIYLGFGRTETPVGKNYASFPKFIAARKADEPFFFWFGDNQTALHSWKRGSGAQAGIDPAKVRVPAYLPDTPVVREEITDYLASVQRTDAAFGEAIALLEQRGELENTIIIHGSDNGWQMPRGLGNVYDAGVHVPLAVRWPGKVQPGRVIEDFVSVTDYAPTILEMAGLFPWPEMTGRSIVDLLTARPGAPARDHVFLERERHANVRRGDLSYPIRAIRTRDFLYIRNIRPNRQPAGDPIVYYAVGDYGDIDNSRTKLHILARREDAIMQRPFVLGFKKRPAEELYDLRNDPEQINNVAAKPEFREVKQRLSAQVDAWMKATADPRVDPNYDEFDKFPYFGGGPAPELKKWDTEK